MVWQVRRHGRRRMSIGGAFDHGIIALAKSHEQMRSSQIVHGLEVSFSWGSPLTVRHLSRLTSPNTTIRDNS